MQNVSSELQAVCSELVKIRRLEPQGTWDNESTTSVIGVPWSLTDGRWTETQSHSRRCHVQEHDSRGKESQSKTPTSWEPLRGVQVATRSWTQARSDRCRVRVKECFRMISQGSERCDRRSEVINEALAVERQKNYQPK